MADDIQTFSIGTPNDLIRASLTVDNTTGTVGGSISALENGISVPVVITTATLGAGGAVNVTGATALGSTVGLAFVEGQPTATVSTNILGITTNTTEAVAVCYLKGTRIRAVRDGEQADIEVETLAIGDMVVTASGAVRPVRWLGSRSYAGRFANANPALLPICFKADAFAEGVPSRDLWVSPAHAMFLDGVLVPASALVNGRSVVKAERVESIEYWHVELDSHDVLLAENTPAESYVEDRNRGIFHNAQSFVARDQASVAVAEAEFCAPRVEGGQQVAALRKRIAERAGLSDDAGRLFGDLLGYVDHCDGAIVSGWAQDTLHPDAPVCLDVVVDGEIVALLYADQHRGDLAPAGIGDGCHAFSMALPLAGTVAHRVEVRRSADGRALQGSPILVPAAAARAA